MDILSNNNILKKIELLAPAKNTETGIAAINSGADAVYISAEQFGARENAGNSINDIAKLVSYAHKFYARVYVTLNTILFDDELNQALLLIKNLYEAGVDALIIQDVGLLELDLPPIPLFASTQMNMDTIEKVLFLEKTGFQRVILPRELTLREIKEIRAKTKIDLECFVHGALCVSESGRCYLSYAIGKRSGNRGRCAQPCRRKYHLRDTSGKILVKNKYLLSLHDLNRSEYLDELIDAGITSFKIEGRLKDLAYVVNIIGFYRMKLDKILENKKMLKSSSGKTFFNFTPEPYKTFNRSYTDYGLCGKKGDLASINTPKSTGEQIGTVKGIDKNFFIISSGRALENGDGICFFDSAKNLKGTTINKVQNNLIYPDKMNYIEKGTIIYRNLDRLFIKQLEKIPCHRRISISLNFNMRSDGFNLEALDEDENKADYSILCEKKIAENKSFTLETIEKQLLKLGETIFTCKKVNINLDKMYFIPVSILNNLRRGVINNLMELRNKNFPLKTAEIIKNTIPYPLKTINYLGNVLNKKAENFYARHNASVIEPAAESGLDMNGRMVMISKYCIRQELGLCVRQIYKCRGRSCTCPHAILFIYGTRKGHPYRFIIGLVAHPNTEESILNSCSKLSLKIPFPRASFISFILHVRTSSISLLLKIISSSYMEKNVWTSSVSKEFE
ncbi:U32 family peptidase [Candidatus Desantisbacteria bacterium]|nr:U32 family peptidase [Candidatus Desantisbacteria bacterium]